MNEWALIALIGIPIFVIIALVIELGRNIKTVQSQTVKLTQLELAVRSQDAYLEGVKGWSKHVEDTVDNNADAMHMFTDHFNNLINHLEEQFQGIARILTKIGTENLHTVELMLELSEELGGSIRYQVAEDKYVSTSQELRDYAISRISNRLIEDIEEAIQHLDTAEEDLDESSSIIRKLLKEMTGEDFSDEEIENIEIYKTEVTPEDMEAIQKAFESQLNEEEMSNDIVNDDD